MWKYQSFPVVWVTKQQPKIYGKWKLETIISMFSNLYRHESLQVFITGGLFRLLWNQMAQKSESPACCKNSLHRNRLPCTVSAYL